LWSNKHKTYNTIMNQKYISSVLQKNSISVSNQAYIERYNCTVGAVFEDFAKENVKIRR